MWTVCNALLGSEAENCKTFFDNYEDDLIFILCSKLKTIASEFKDLFLDIISLLHKLLDLDDQYPDTLTGTDKVKTAIENHKGFENIEQL